MWASVARTTIHALKVLLLVWQQGETTALPMSLAGLVDTLPVEAWLVVGIVALLVGHDLWHTILAWTAAEDTKKQD